MWIVNNFIDPWINLTTVTVYSDLFLFSILSLTLSLSFYPSSSSPSPSSSLLLSILSLRISCFLVALYKAVSLCNKLMKHIYTFHLHLQVFFCLSSFFQLWSKFKVKQILNRRKGVECKSSFTPLNRLPQFNWPFEHLRVWNLWWKQNNCICYWLTVFYFSPHTNRHTKHRHTCDPKCHLRPSLIHYQLIDDRLNERLITRFIF